MVAEKMFLVFDRSNTRINGRARFLKARYAILFTAFLMFGSLLSTDVSAETFTAFVEPDQVVSYSRKCVMWYEDSLQKVPRYFDGERNFRSVVKKATPEQNAAKLRAVRDERESFQVLLTPKRAQSVRVSDVSVSKLTGTEHEDVIPVDNIRINLVGYVNRTTPDVLLPKGKFRKAGAFENYNLWYTVHVPSDVSAGKYEGTVEVLSDSGKMVCPIQLNVADVSLPEETSVMTQAFTIDIDSLRWWYDDLEEKDMLPFIRKHIYPLFARNRISPAGPFRFKGGQPAPAPVSAEGIEYFKNYMEYWVEEQGLYGGALPAGDQWSTEKRRRFWERYYPILQNNGWTDPMPGDSRWIDKVYAWVGPDEGWSAVKYAEQTIEVCKDLKEFAPEVSRNKTFGRMWAFHSGKQYEKELARTVIPALERHLGWLDIWAIDRYAYYEYPIAVGNFYEQNVVGNGSELSWYIHFDIPVKHTALRLRSFFWQMAKFDIQKCFLWRANLWKRGGITWSQPKGIGGTRIAGGGVGNPQLFWPAEDRDTVYSSMRMELIRDGIEDVDLMHKLRNLVARAREQGTGIDPSGELKIRKAVYGALGQEDKTEDVTEKLRGMIEDNALSVRVKDHLTGGEDPAPEASKSLRVAYTVGDTARTREAAWAKMLEIPNSSVALSDRLLNRIKTIPVRSGGDFNKFYSGDFSPMVINRGQLSTLRRRIITRIEELSDLLK